MDLEEYINCQICSKRLKTTSILRHIGHSENCRNKYPTDKLNELKTAANMRKRSQLKEIKRKNYDSQKRSDENKRYYENNKKEIRSKQRDYHESKKGDIRSRKRENYENNKTLEKFHEECQFGPIFPCICCKRCLPKRGVKLIQNQFLEFLKENKIDSYIDMTGTLIDGSFHICHSCHSNLSKKKMPNLCFKNGLQLANVPDCLQISSLGNQLLAKHLIFLKIRSLPKTGMGKMNDRVSILYSRLHIYTNSKLIYHFIGNQCSYC